MLFRSYGNKYDYPKEFVVWIASVLCRACIYVDLSALFRKRLSIVYIKIRGIDFIVCPADFLTMYEIGNAGDLG